jgi:hypothetical protein
LFLRIAFQWAADANEAAAMVKKCDAEKRFSEFRQIANNIIYRTQQLPEMARYSNGYLPEVAKTTNACTYGRQ